MNKPVSLGQDQLNRRAMVTVMMIFRIKFHKLKVMVVLMAMISLSGVSVVAMISFRRLKMVAIQNGQGLLEEVGAYG